MKYAVEAKVRDLMVKYFLLDREQLAGNPRISEDLHFDSLDKVELSFVIEEGFDTLLTDDDCESWTTLSDVISFCKNLTA